MAENFAFYDILQNETYGRYAVASKNLEPGELIITEPPFTYGPKSDSPPVCLGCHCQIDAQTMCSKCGWPVCGRECEELPIHAENECVVFSSVKYRFSPVKDVTLSCPQYECIMPLRVLLTKERNPEKWESEMKALESHEEERKKSEIWNVETVNVVEFLHKVCKLQDRFSAELIHFACGILEVNAFAAPISVGNEMRCIYPKTSLLTHSCVPNVSHFIFAKSEDGSEFQIYVRATVGIEKGKELLLTYTQTLSPTLLRRAHLKEGKYFDCSCRRCADPTELGTNLSTLKCSKCDNGWVLSSNSLDESALWKCTCCEFMTKGESVTRLFNIIQQEIGELHYTEESDPVACREAFLKKYRSILHPSHALLLQVKSSLTQLYGKAEGYFLQDLPDIILERKIELCYLINKVSNVIKPGLSTQRGNFTFRPDQVFPLLVIITKPTLCEISNSRGWNLYELHAPLIVLARNQLERKEIDQKQLRRKLEEAAGYLEESARIFSYEDPISPEGTVRKIALQSLAELKNSIESLPK